MGKTILERNEERRLKLLQKQEMEEEKKKLKEKNRIKRNTRRRRVYRKKRKEELKRKEYDKQVKKDLPKALKKLYGEASIELGIQPTNSQRAAIGSKITKKNALKLLEIDIKVNEEKKRKEKEYRQSEEYKEKRRQQRIAKREKIKQYLLALESVEKRRMLLHFFAIRNRISYEARRRKKRKENFEAIMLGQKSLENKRPAYYSIVIVKNQKKIETVSKSTSKKLIIREYSRLLGRNKSSVTLPNIVTFKGRKEASDEYELLLLGHNTSVDKTSYIKETKTGEYINHIVEDDKDIHILRANPIYYECLFYLYVYNPVSDKKDVNFLTENVIDKRLEELNGIKVVMWNNKLILDYNNDIDIVFANTKTTSKHIYDYLENKYQNVENIYFLGEYRQEENKIVEKIQEKTNWAIDEIKDQKCTL